MRKRIINIVVIIGTLLTAWGGNWLIQAASITKSGNVAKFKVVSKSNSSYYYEYNFPHVYVDGAAAYCLQPNVSIITGSYSSSKEWSNYSAAKREKMSLYMYYGYQYPGHKSLNYYLATQSLVWDVIGWNTTWYKTASTTKISVTKEINDIKALAAKHDILPSFAGATIDLRPGEEMPLVDSNEVLSNFVFQPDPQVEIRQDGNKLIITLLSKLDSKLELQAQRKNGLPGGVPIIYTKSGSQKLLVARADNGGFFTLDLESQNNSLKLIKTDTRGNAVEGAIFKIGRQADLSDGKQYTTDGIGQINCEELEAGLYYYQEIWAPAQYIVDPSIGEIELTAEETTIIRLENQIKKLELKILKQDQESLLPLAGAEFSLYRLEEETEEYLRDAVTDKNGTVSFEGLEYYESYRACETKLPEGYEYPDDQRCWDFRAADQPYQASRLLTIDNRLRRLRLQLLKIDENQKETALNGAYFTVSDTTAKQEIGTFVTGALYLQDQAFAEYYVYSETDYETVDETTLNRHISMTLKTNKDGEIVEYLPEGRYYVSKLVLPGDLTTKENSQIQTVDIKPGVISVGELKYGHYYNICETQAPLGYQLNKKRCTVLQAIAPQESEEFEIHLENAPVYIPYTGSDEHQLLPVGRDSGA